MTIGAARPVLGISSHSSPTVASAQSIAFHAISIFLQDCRDLVSTQISPGIKRGLRSIDEEELQLGKQRKKALSLWLKSLHPLSWTEPEGPQNGTYARLVTMIHDDPHTKPRALQHSPTRLTYEELATRLYDIGTSSNGAIRAPVWKNGAFLHALPVAIKLIARRESTSENRKPFTISIFTHMIKRMGIEFIPWHMAGSNVAYSVRYDHWLILDRNTSRSPQIILDEDSEEAVRTNIAGHAADSIASAPWSLPEDLHQMGVLWDKTVLPTDWSLDHASLNDTITTPNSAYVRETYQYVQQHYDGNIWWHHFAFVLGLLFSKITPFVFYPKTQPIIGKTPQALTKGVRAMPWTEGTSKKHKGVTSRLPYITMFSTMVFALLDKKSPLALYMASHSNSFGDAWSSKHGAF
jgi:hypothetical protein